MSRQTARKVAWGIVGITVVLATATVVLSILNRSMPVEAETLPIWLNLSFQVLFLLIVTIGALIIARQPGNATGWLMAGLGIIGSLVGAGETYAINALLINPGVLPFGEMAAWFSFYRSRGVERQQLKWLVYGGMTFSLVLISGPLFWFGLAPLEAAWPILFLLGLAAMPMCIGIAITRYDLYDIDQIINRAIVYTVLTTGLIGVYAGMVLVLTMLSAPLLDESGFTVAISPLLVAALFRPARNCIQALVDRHFYRQKYDAARTVEIFNARLRDEVDLETLADDLQRAVRHTMQPAHVLLWLRPAPAISSQRRR